jgi:hypothetical protein
VAEYEHLPLPRADENLERRKRPGFGSIPLRDPRTHGRTVQTQLEAAVTELRRRPLPTDVDPSLILRVRMQGTTAEDLWEASGLTVLSVDADKTLVLFSSDQAMAEFRRRLAAYRAGPAPGRIGAPYSGLVASIAEVGTIRPEDRIGPLLRADGFVSPNDFADDENYAVDLELWDLGTRGLREDKVDEIEAYVQHEGGEVTDRYLGTSLTLLRIRALGATIKNLLDIPDVSSMDLPPTPDAGISGLLDLTIQDFPPPEAPPDDAPSITVVDTGLTAAHPLLEPAVGETIGVPPMLRDDDTNGHGTRVAGIAVYGDVRSRAEALLFQPEIRVHSAKIVNDAGCFDDRLLVASQMRLAVEHFHLNHGCRVFNISLGDRRLVYDGGKVGPWAATLDELARELNVLIVISAGNLAYSIPQGEEVESHLIRYPDYLIEKSSRIVEPANAAIALTVGSIAHAASVPAEDHYGVKLRPVASLDEPSPFTRCGPGVGGAVKPELCDYGGNLMFDGGAQVVSDNWPETSLLTLNNQYLSSLFTTAVGTSYSAPRVAYKAARILARFPDASANLIRALLASSAIIPAAAAERLQPLAADACPRICGFGVPDTMRAMTSDNRVVLYADTTIALDHFFIYEVAIPEEFLVTRGRRHIRVTLAFDPPVRHTRIDYLGTRMSFRLVRGATLEEVIEFYRRRPEEDGPPPDMPNRNNCDLKPGPNSREMGTLQRAELVMKNNPLRDYGDTYYLVVRCERRWADELDSPQRFAIVVDLSHEAEILLYARLQERIRLRARARP